MTGALAEDAKGVPQIGEQVLHAPVTIQAAEGFQNFCPRYATFYVSVRRIHVERLGNVHTCHSESGNGELKFAAAR
jgi:hypothetical protein